MKTQNGMDSIVNSGVYLIKDYFVAAIVGLLILPSASLAQEEADAASADPKRKNRLLEEVVVTAQKREENNQDVPISVTAFNEMTLDALGIEDPQDLQRVTPGLTYNTAVGFSIIYMRGIGSDAFLMADPSVALYIDGVYFPFAQGLAQTFGGVERIEVLKGPQGTLFGRNAVGGAINIHSKNPGQDVELSAQLSYGSYNTKSIQVNGSYPITDKLAVSISAFDSSGESYYDGFMNGEEKIPDEKSEGIRLKARWDITDAFTLNLAGFDFKSSGPGSLVTPNRTPSPLFQTTIDAEKDYNAAFDAGVDQELHNKVYYGSIDWSAAWFDAKILASKQDIQTGYMYDYDGSTNPIVAFSAENQFAKVDTAEIQILSNENSWGSDWLSWIFGAYFFESTQGFDPVRLEALGLASSIPPELETILSQLGVVPTGAALLEAVIGTESQAYFVQSTATITDWFSVTLGARYQEEKRTVIKSGSALQTSDGGSITLADFGDGRNETTYSFKPKVSLDFRPFEEQEVLFYLSFQQALKSSTYNVVTLSDEPDYVLPEELEAYEIGMKSEWLDGKIRLNIAAFEYELKNQQVQFVSVLQGGAISFENAGGSEVNGADFDAMFEIFPDVIDGLVLTASGAYLNGTFTDYTEANGYDEETGQGFTDGDYTGNVIPRTPTWTATLGLNKAFYLENGSIEAGVDAYYNSGYYYLPQNTDADFQPEYNTLNARVSFFYDPWGLQLTVFGNNLEDKKYTDGSFQTDFGILSHLAKPANYGIKLKWIAF